MPARRALLLLAALGAGLALEGTLGAAPRPGGPPGEGAPAGPAGSAGGPGKAGPATAAADSGDTFLPLSRRPLPRGLGVGALVSDGPRVWAVGDSGLVAWSEDDSVFQRLEAPDALPLTCAALSGRELVCAGDSGRVFRVTDGRVRRAGLRDRRAVRDLSFDGERGLLGGDAGLLARSADGGRTWDTLAAPLPIRFSAVHVAGETCWAGGAGGRVFRSPDGGQSWALLARLAGGVADLAAAGPGRAAVLDREGGIHLADAAGLRELDRLPEGRAVTLAAVAGGWAVGAEGGRVAVLDTAAGSWRRGRLPEPVVVSGLATRGETMLIGGAWGTIALWRPGAGDPTPLRHGLAPAAAAPAAAAPVPAAAVESPGDTLTAALADSINPGSPRCFQNVLDTETRCTTPPTRLHQLERSYDNTRWLGLAARAMLALDVDAGGELDSIHVLEEWPPGLGVGAQARQLAASLTFTPGFRQGGTVPTRLLYPVVFPGSAADYEGWARGEREAGALLDSLLARLPKARSALPPKQLVKAMGFPRKARRFIWEGGAVVEYRLDAAGAISRPRVLWESEARYAFGRHAVEILPDLAMALPDSLAPAPGDHLRVVQRFNFDRKRYSRAAREMAEGFEFAPVRFSQAESDSARYDPGRAQLEWLLNDFFGAAGEGGWPELHCTLVMKRDGRLFDFTAAPADSGRSLEPAALRSLALQFTWGRPADSSVADLDTLALTWRPAAFRADSLNAPPSLRALLRDVVY